MPRLGVARWRSFLAGLLAATAILAVSAQSQAEPGQAKPAPAKPARIVSLNVCTDQLVLLLAERERIASLSYLAVDPATSALSDRAQGLPLNHGLVEEVAPLAPDLVLASVYTLWASVRLLRRLGYRVIALPTATDFDGIRANVRAVAEAIGERDRGAALIAEFDRRLAAARAPPQAAKPLVALYWARGYGIRAKRGALNGGFFIVPTERVRSEAGHAAR